ncbi:Hypothetical protein ADU71_1497 [Pediococcus damnosus]|nr:Hypothetical protein ADU69_1376 [Pediococcus damnosus]AMV65389.1 Hypothetical protein ADU71_1497 [Pediococcus damnosus]AMV68764.1 Hypothetical protein ADU73_0354 [Pediococcus damnosus]
MLTLIQLSIRSILNQLEIHWMLELDIIPKKIFNGQVH